MISARMCRRARYNTRKSASFVMAVCDRLRAASSSKENNYCDEAMIRANDR
jgi:hypothetical protein